MSNYKIYYKDSPQGNVPFVDINNIEYQIVDCNFEMDYFSEIIEIKTTCDKNIRIEKYPNEKESRIVIRGLIWKNF
jgi:hypothetical protein